MLRATAFISICVLVSACKASVQNAPPEKVDTTHASIQLTPAFPKLQFQQPVFMLQAPGDDTHFYVVEQRGTVRVFQADDEQAAVFVDLTDRVRDGGEKGLLGMAFHPDYATNGYAYLSYTNANDSVISRFTRKGDVLDPASEKIVLTVRQPFSNHNGGQIEFGPDGYLYIGLGDGGAAGDPFGHGQNTDTLLGAMLRIDVKQGDPYSIPADNPFAQGGGAKEIYAWGLRNPWRWSFDRQTGELWLGDVGQNQWEEIDIVVRGGNYGWNIREAAHCFTEDDCDSTGLQEPVYEYSHASGISVTGGYVYRGTKYPALQGAYFFADFGSGRIWATRREGENFVTTVVLESQKNIPSFAQDNSGELYVLDYGGQIFSLIEAK